MEGFDVMTPTEMEDMLRNHDLRLQAIEQILPTLATREELRVGLEEVRRHTDIRFESLHDDIVKVADGVAALSVQVQATNQMMAQALVRLDRHELRLDAMDAKLRTTDTKLNALDAKVDGLDAKVNALDAKVDGLDEKVNATNARLDVTAAKLDTTVVTVDATAADIRSLTDRLERRGVI